MFRFSIRDLLWLTVVVAVLVAWGIEWTAGMSREKTMRQQLTDALVEQDKAKQQKELAWEMAAGFREAAYKLQIEVKALKKQAAGPGP